MVNQDASKSVSQEIRKLVSQQVRQSYMFGRRELVVDRQVLDGVVPEHLVADAVLLPDVEEGLRQQPLPPLGQVGGVDGRAEWR